MAGISPGKRTRHPLRQERANSPSPSVGCRGSVGFLGLGCVLLPNNRNVRSPSCYGRTRCTSVTEPRLRKRKGDWLPHTSWRSLQSQDWESHVLLEYWRGKFFLALSSLVVCTDLGAAWVVALAIQSLSLKLCGIRLTCLYSDFPFLTRLSITSHLGLILFQYDLILSWLPL